MQPDTKQKVLFGIYTEYQKDVPRFSENVTPDTLGVDPLAFRIAVDKLQSEQLIDRAMIVEDGNTPYPKMVILDRVTLTRYGMDYVEDKISVVSSSTGEEKVKTVAQKAAEWGWSQMKDIAVKTLAERLKG